MWHFREPVRVLFHLGGGYTKVLLERTVGVGLADGGVMWDIPTEAIPPRLRGIDSRFLYVAIQMYGLDKQTTDGTNTPLGLIARYGFRFSKDADGRNGYLFVVDRPERKGVPGTTFHQWGTSGWRDTDADVGGRGLINGTPPSGRSVTKSDNPQEGNGLTGYDQQRQFDLVTQEVLPALG